MRRFAPVATAAHPGPAGSRERPPADGPDGSESGSRFPALVAEVTVPGSYSIPAGNQALVCVDCPMR